jgi:hypothetical protein
VLAASKRGRIVGRGTTLERTISESG